MKVFRSAKCSLKFATESKRLRLRQILVEYGAVVNTFIDYFWNTGTVPKRKLLKPVIDLPNTWLTSRLRQVAAREALDMISTVKKRWANSPEKISKPIHRGDLMTCSSTVARLEDTRTSAGFDAWLHLYSLGKGVILDLPVKFHRHYNRLCGKGKRLNAYIVTAKYVQFCFCLETGEKRNQGKTKGVDTGINALASLNDGRQFGLDIKAIIESINRCLGGSKRQKRLRRALRQRMDEVAKEITSEPDLQLVVVEKLKNLNKNTRKRRRLGRKTRRSLGTWAYRYWLNRVQMGCENNRVVFRSVPPAYTSQRCHACGHIERGNRSGEKFRCRSCGHTDNADINAARNILDRFLRGPYGAPFQLKNLRV